MAININGDGLIELGGTSTTQGRVRLAEDTDNGTNYVELTAPASVTSNKTITFPDETGTVITTATTTGINANAISSGTLVAARGGTGITDPGTSGNVLTSNGTAWLSQALPSASDYIMQVYTTPGTATWTKPAGLKAIKVTVVGGGGGSSGLQACGVAGYGGGGGGASIEYIDAPAIPGPQPYTVGAGGAAGGNGGPTPSFYGGTGGTSSFGGPTAFLSATGGAGGGNSSPSGLGTSAGGVGSNGQLNIGGGNSSYSNPTTILSGGSILGGLLAGTAGGFSSPALPAGVPGAPKGYGVGSIGYAFPVGTGVVGGGGVVIVEEFY